MSLFFCNNGDIGIRIIFLIEKHEYNYIFYTFGNSLNKSMYPMITQQDQTQLAAKGIPEAQIKKQLERFINGFPYLNIKDAAAINRGILCPNKKELIQYIETWDEYIKGDKTILKFVPASGAASRMFKDLFSFLEASYDIPTTSFEKEFFARISKFAFYKELDDICITKDRKDISTLLNEGSFKRVITLLLNAEGLNYGSLPKALLTFHAYKDETRTPFEEHLVEGALYASTHQGKSNIHFTVSSEHRELFETLLKNKLEVYSNRYNINYSVSFSEQKMSTDTLAVDLRNRPFRNEDGTLLFRPAGHGALIENLNELEADIVFIKNIDNVVPDRLKADTIFNKKLLAGVLVTLQSQVFAYLKLLDSGSYSSEKLLEILQFIEQKLYCTNTSVANMEDTDLVLYLKSKLNRPMRVCGMVKNVGEPGGGPFLAYNPDGSISLQILESSQIEMDNNEKKMMFEKGTHFNPVDLVCSLHDYKGNKFTLTDYVDPSTGFISNKSKNGRALKALELPGLWNGAMSNWSTVFVEVPLTTFNPVKTINDLLREQHQ